jgi:serine/threonine-protein kinase RsbT
MEPIVMSITRSERAEIRASDDIVRVRRLVRTWMAADSFSLIDQTKMVTATSELARNIVDYGHGGSVQIETVLDGGRSGVRLVFEDSGPGIPDIELALTDGYTTGDGLGLGLGGARRLVNEFAIESQPGHGTRVMIARWR